MSAVENRSSRRNAVLQMRNHFQKIRFAHRSNIALILFLAINLFQACIEFIKGLFASLVLFAHFIELLAEFFGGPPQVSFQNLPDVHTRRHAQRIEHDVNRRAVFHVRHILQRQNAGNRTLVTVTSGNFIA